MKACTKFLITAFTAAIPLAVLSPESSANLLVNPSMEAPAVQNGDGNFRPDGWGGFSNSFFADDRTARSGDANMFILGAFNGDPAFSGLFQDVNGVAPGAELEASIWTLNDATRLDASNLPDTIEGRPNRVDLVIEFFDQFGGNILSEDGDPNTNNPTVTLADGLDPNFITNEYYQRSVTGIAPAGTVRARLLVLFVQSGFAGGIVDVDDASLTVVPEPVTGALLGLGALLLRRRPLR